MTLLVIALFVLPGYLWARRFAEPAWWRVSVGAMASFGVYGVVAVPFLWWHGTVDGVIVVLAAIGALSAALCARGSASPGEPPNGAPAGLSRDPLGLLRSPVGRCASFALGGYCFLVVLLVRRFEWLPPRQAALFSILALAGAFLLARRGVALVDKPLGRYLLPAVIAVQAVLAVVAQVPDWDDAFYLGATLQYSRPGPLAVEEPTHREGLPLTRMHRTMTWELWGAVIGRLTGIDPLTLYHGLLPFLLVWLAYGAYAVLFRELLPYAQAGPALLGLSACHLTAIAIPMTPASLFLPRAWLAKSVLLHVALPLTAAFQIRLAKKPSLTEAIAYLLAATFASTVCLTGVLLVPLLGCALGLALWRAAADRRALVTGTALAVAPTIALALVMHAGLRETEPTLPGWNYLGSWWQTARAYAHEGGMEWLWALTLPLQWAVFRGRWARAYFVTMPLLVLATALNPLAHHWVAAHVTSFKIYWRLFWLLPMAAGAGAAGALLFRRQPAVAIALVALLPGHNLASHIREEYRARAATLFSNPARVPDDLLPIARRLAAEPAAETRRILCNEGVATFLIPFSARLRFVETRAWYTPLYLAKAGRAREGLERHFLAGLLREGSLPERYRLGEWRDLDAIFGVDAMAAMFGRPPENEPAPAPEELLRRYAVGYAITAPGDRAGEAFRALGFREEMRSGRFALWSRP